MSQGDIVCIAMENRLDYCCYWMGLGMVGITPALINNHLRQVIRLQSEWQSEWQSSQQNLYLTFPELAAAHPHSGQEPGRHLLPGNLLRHLRGPGGAAPAHEALHRWHHHGHGGRGIICRKFGRKIKRKIKLMKRSFVIQLIQLTSNLFSERPFFQQKTIAKHWPCMEGVTNLVSELPRQSTEIICEKYLGYNDPMVYIYTSGTTGLPKAATVKHSR